MAKPLTFDRFAAQVETATRDAGYTVEKREGGILWLNLKGNTMRCNLETAYRAYLTSPQRLQDVIQAHLNALGKVPAVPAPPDAKTAAESLLPLLQQARWAEQKTQVSGVRLVHRPFVTGLVITYVFDMPDHRAYVNESMVQEIVGEGRTSLETFHEYALNNLRLRARKHKAMTVGSGRQTLISCETQDGYAATSILLPELLDGWAKKIPGRLLLGIPNRDFIIAFSDQNPAGVEVVADQVRRDARERQNPLLSRLLVWEGGKLRELTPLH
jgi:uncharacterized protein YtpQ (UPF0354 family)